MTGACEGCAGQIGICDLLQMHGQYITLNITTQRSWCTCTLLSAGISLASSHGQSCMIRLDVVANAPREVFFLDTCSLETLFQTISSLPQNCMYRQAGVLYNQTCSSCIVSQCEPAGPYIEISESTPTRGTSIVHSQLNHVTVLLCLSGI